MARIEALSILQDTSGKEYLAELYGKVIENVQKNLVSYGMKNTDLSGDPTSGSVEAKRFVNAKSQDYGTARAAGKGNQVKAKPVVVAIDTDSEIVEEIEEKDTRLYGVDGLLERRSANHVLSMATELDTEFFKVAAEAATADSRIVARSTPSSTTLPPVGLSSAAKMFKSVVLPEPDSPMMATYSPCATLNVTLRSASTALAPKRVA